MARLRQPANGLTITAAPGDGTTDIKRRRAEVPKPFISTACSVTKELDFVSV